MFNYYMPSRILFGAGKLDELGSVQLPGKKAMIVISCGKSMRANGYLERVENLLRKNGAESIVYDKILPNPICTHVDEAADIAKKEKCDFIIGLGGGSTIDATKAIAVMAKNEGKYWDYIPRGTGGKKPVKEEALPIIAITTTAGTGTEADPFMVISNPDTEEKIGFGVAPVTFPVLSIVDPELMLTVPAHLTAYQGFDTLFHASEGYISNKANEMSDMFALQSVSLIAKSLAKAVDHGSDLDARTDVALANTLAGVVECTSSCTSEHAMEHAMSAYQPSLPHGAGLIMLSVPYFTFFAQKVPERMADLARAMGKKVDGLPLAEQAMQFVEALKELQASCHVAGLKMSDYNIKKEQLPDYVTKSKFTMGQLFDNDRHYLSDAECLSIFEEAYL